ncbi:NINE protein [Psychroserpens sp. S379A]|uniref:NINE protein n=1 Tax=Psychroserpens sp. S379A TaxID=3415137 RepID=UPI003C7E343C
MSDDNKNLSDDLNDMLGDAKEGAKKAADKVSDKASEFADEAKETASEFADSAKEAFNSASGDNKKILAGILGIILGWAGVHKFVLGYNKEGAIMLIASIVLYFLTCGIGTMVVSIIGLIEGIIYLTKSDEEFYNTYQVGKKPWF